MSRILVTNEKIVFTWDEKSTIIDILINDVVKPKKIFFSNKSICLK